MSSVGQRASLAEASTWFAQRMRMRFRKGAQRRIFRQSHFRLEKEKARNRWLVPGPLLCVYGW